MRFYSDVLFQDETKRGAEVYGGWISATVPQINKVIIVTPDEVLRKIAAFFDLGG